jgi:hypothetical protein
MTRALPPISSKLSQPLAAPASSKKHIKTDTCPNSSSSSSSSRGGVGFVRHARHARIKEEKSIFFLSFFFEQRLTTVYATCSARVARLARGVIRQSFHGLGSKAALLELCESCESSGRLLHGELVR